MGPGERSLLRLSARVPAERETRLGGNLGADVYYSGTVAGALQSGMRAARQVRGD